MKKFAYLCMGVMICAVAGAQAQDRTTVKKRVGVERQPNPFEAYLGRPIGYDTDGYGLYSTDRIEQLVRGAAEKARADCNGKGQSDASIVAEVFGGEVGGGRVQCENHVNAVKRLLRKKSARDQVKNAALFAEVSAIATIADAMNCDMTEISRYVLGK
ncbi:MAG: hypothetical protein VX730_02795 [Pseudomonadota bacterium]|nr:hypothetical protein [Pseudomonadota bacterium]